ncbi:MAG: hypothetical protein IKD73_08480 [Selenomonadaceae bacterium]|nr:hypothetical protein [Selenomonadaceae bacterium]
MRLEGVFGSLPMTASSAVHHAVRRPNQEQADWERGTHEDISPKDFNKRALEIPRLSKDDTDSSLP